MKISDIAIKQAFEEGFEDGIKQSLDALNAYDDITRKEAEKAISKLKPDYRALSAVLPKLMVKVHELEWVQDEHGSIEFTAQSMFGEYNVHIERKSAYGCSLDGVKYEHININHPYTLEQAKAAAQADYERRMLQGLEIVKADIDVAAVRRQALEDAMQAIASLPTGRDESEMAGQEDAYRAIQALSAELPKLTVKVRQQAFDEALNAVGRVKDNFMSDEYATPQPMGSLSERFACDVVGEAIRSLSAEPAQGEQLKRIGFIDYFSMTAIKHGADFSEITISKAASDTYTYPIYAALSGKEPS